MLKRFLKNDRGRAKNWFAILILLALIVLFARGILWVAQKEQTGVLAPLSRTYEKYLKRPLAQLEKKKENKFIRENICEPLFSGAEKVAPGYVKDLKNRPCELLAFVPVAIVLFFLLLLMLGYLFGCLKKRKNREPWQD